MNEPEDEWVPRISCQSCGEWWPLGETIRHDCKISRRASAPGLKPSLGIVGVRGPLMSDSDQLARARIDVSTTPEDGLNTFQGRLVDISSPWSAERVGEFTLTVSFDSRTHRRLLESLYGDPGLLDMDGVECLLTTPTVEPPTT